jgi:hypothetical protein
MLTVMLVVAALKVVGQVAGGCGLCRQNLIGFWNLRGGKRQQLIGWWSVERGYGSKLFIGDI